MIISSKHSLAYGIVDGGPAENSARPNLDRAKLTLLGEIVDGGLRDMKQRGEFLDGVVLVLVLSLNNLPGAVDERVGEFAEVLGSYDDQRVSAVRCHDILKCRVHISLLLFSCYCYGVGLSVNMSGAAYAVLHVRNYARCAYGIETCQWEVG